MRFVWKRLIHNNQNGLPFSSSTPQNVNIPIMFSHSRTGNLISNYTNGRAKIRHTVHFPKEQLRKYLPSGSTDYNLK